MIKVDPKVTGWGTTTIEIIFIRLHSAATRYYNLLESDTETHLLMSLRSTYVRDTFTFTVLNDSASGAIQVWFGISMKPNVNE